MSAITRTCFTAKYDVSRHRCLPPSSCSFAYTRSLGPTLGAFMTGLAGAPHRRRARLATARVLRPAGRVRPDHPRSADRLRRRRRRGHGRQTWSWAAEPLRRPAARPPVRVGARHASTARTPRCCTRSTSTPPTRCRPACGCARAGPTSAPARSPTSSASNRRPASRASRRPAPTSSRSTITTTPIDAARASTRRRRRRRSYLLGLAAGQAARPALPGVRQGLHPAARRLPGRRRADRARRSSCPTAASSRRSASSTCRSTGRRSSRRTSRAYVLLDGADIAVPAPDPRLPRPRTCGWACGSRRCGSRATSGARRCRTSTTSVRPASRTPTTTSFKEHL